MFWVRRERETVLSVGWSRVFLMGGVEHSGAGNGTRPRERNGVERETALARGSETEWSDRGRDVHILVGM